MYVVCLMEAILMSIPNKHVTLFYRRSKRHSYNKNDYFRCPKCMFCVDKLKKSSAINIQSLHTYSSKQNHPFFLVVCMLKL